MVNRDFTAGAPNRLWVADATRIVTGEGVLWLAAVRDTFSNRIVGWKTSDRCDTELVYRAAWRTRDEAENAIFAYIGGWYNRERIQKDLCWLSPDECEASWYAKNIDTDDPATAVRAAHEGDLPLLRREDNPRSHDVNSAARPYP